MVKRIDELGYCGANCGECNIYRSMLYGEELKPETVERWQEDARKYWHVDTLDPKDLNCRGCRYEGEDVFYGFRLCPIKKCCKEKGLVSCGACPDFSSCKLLEPEGKANLHRILLAGE